MSDQAKTPEEPKQAASEEMEQLKELLETYGRPVAAVLIGVLVIISVSNFISNSRTKNANAASAALATARNEADLESVVVDYAKSAVAPYALMTLAKAHFDNDRFDVASTKYNEFISKYPQRPEAIAARFGLLMCTEAAGDDASIAEAEAGYKAFAVANPDSYLMTQALLGEARCLIHAKKLDDARVIYEEMIDTQTDSQWVPLVADLLDSLKGEIARSEGPQMPTPTYTPSPAAMPVIPGMPAMSEMAPITIPAPAAPVVTPVPAPVPAPAPVATEPAPSAL
jgi:predicted negative regulator of RcsB-dependent stress response